MFFFFFWGGWYAHVLTIGRSHTNLSFWLLLINGGGGAGESSDTVSESTCCNSLWDSALAASLVEAYYFFIVVSQTVLALSFGKQQRFSYAHGFCESGIWTTHSENGSFLLHSVWGLNWWDLNCGGWNHLEMSLFLYYVPELGWLGASWAYPESICNFHSLHVVFLCVFCNMVASG